MNRILTISVADQLFTDHPEVKKSLLALLETAFDNKKALFSPAEEEGPLSVFPMLMSIQLYAIYLLFI